MNEKIEFIRDIPNTNPKKVELRCYCGNLFKRKKYYYNTGNVKSCGCSFKIFRKTQPFPNFTHGLTVKRLRHPLYNVWNSMIQRCGNSKFLAYKRYGGRGISVLNEWILSPTSFYEWAIYNGWEKGLELDRINNDGNYEPSNCRFVTHKINNNNRCNSINKLEYKGEINTLWEWSKKLDIPYSTLYYRLFTSNKSVDESFGKS